MKEASGGRGIYAGSGSGKNRGRGAAIARPMLIDGRWVVLAKSLVYFSSACCTGAVGITLMPLRCLQCENSCRLTDRQTKYSQSLRVRAEDFNKDKGMNGFAIFAAR